MPYSLRTGLSFCHAEGRTIFLDITADRYFELAATRAQVLEAGDSVIESQARDARALLAMGLLVLAPAGNPPIAPFSWPKPTRSLIEDSPDVRIARWDLPLAALALASAWVRLRRGSFGGVLSRLGERRRRLGPPADPGAVRAVAARFNACRRLLPLRAICLRDSLAMLEFLATHGLTADLVIGVEAAPFSAHCWVQAGDDALNESVLQAARHTPILAA